MNALKFTKSNPIEINLLADLIQKGNYKDAENIAYLMTEKNPNNKFGWLILCAIYNMQGRKNELLIASKKIVAIKPDDHEAHNILANTLISLNKLNEAENSYRRAIELKQDFAEGHINLGITLNKLGKLNEAELSYKKALEITPNHSGAHFNLGLTLSEIGRLQDAETSYKNAIKIKHDFAEAHCNLGNTLKKLGKLEESVSNYKLAIEIKPNFVEAYSNLGLILSDLGRLNDAVINYRKAIEFKEDFAEAHCNLGITLNKMGRLNEAESSYKKALTFRPTFVEALNNLSITLNELGRLQDAEVCLTKAINIRPDYAEAHNNLGLTLIEVGRLDDAEQSFKKAIAFKPDYAEAHSNLGITLQELGKLEEAEASYKKAIAIKPDFANAILNSAVLSLYQNQITDSIKLLKNVIEINSGDFGLRATVKLAVLHFMSDDLHAAHLLIENSKEIFESKSKSVKNDAAYHILMDSLISWQRMNEYPSYEYIDQRLHVVGDSHSMSSNRLYIESLNGGSLCKVHWIAGCKQWHLGNSKRNQYKEQFERVFHSFPYKSTILLSIGEIDCRVDDGILKHIKKHPSTNQSTLIESTIGNYLTYVYNITNIKANHVVIQGVPCPNIDPAKVEEKDISILVDLIKEFNYELGEKSKKMGFEFLDLHKLTDRGDGYSNGIWHIDEYHLSPAGMLEAWKRHLA